MYKIPARDTVAGVAVRKVAISNNSLMDFVKAMRSLLASVNTYVKSQIINIKGQAFLSVVIKFYKFTVPID